MIGATKPYLLQVFLFMHLRPISPTVFLVQFSQVNLFYEINSECLVCIGLFVLT